MLATELNLMRTHIIRMVCDESNEQVLSEVERVLVASNLSDAPCRYSSTELQQRVRRATASIRAGKGYMANEMKSLRPHL